MASRKMTFTVPEDLAAQLLKHVPARDRSRYVSEAISARLRQREERLIRACKTANSDPDALAIEREWDTLTGAIAEPWNDAPPR
jgi:hypothetical protein